VVQQESDAEASPSSTRRSARFRDRKTAARNVLRRPDSTALRRDVWGRLVPTHPLRGGASRLVTGNPVHLVCTWRPPATGGVGRYGH
jgi:hypothetical protein